MLSGAFKHKLLAKSVLLQSVYRSHLAKTSAGFSEGVQARLLRRERVLGS